MIQGSLYGGNGLQTNGYYGEMNVSNTMAAGTDYTFLINSDGVMNNKGGRGLLVSEMRLWSVARTLSEIASNRYHQVDPILFRDRLLSYFKLLSGATDESKKVATDMDLADPTMKRLLTVSGDV
jgi:hypothetical protein